MLETTELTETGKTAYGKWSLVKVGNRWITSDGRWHDTLLATFLLRRFAHNSDLWTEVGELAQVAFGQNCEHNRRKVRARLSGLQGHLLQEGRYLLVTEDRSKPGSKVKVRWRVKLYNHDSMIDRLAVRSWIDKMVSTQELQGEKIALAESICKTRSLGIPSPQTASEV